MLPTSALRRLLRRRRRPFGPAAGFRDGSGATLSLTDEPVDRARTLAEMYHKGQQRAWDGRRELADAINTHGRVELSPRREQALQHLVRTLMWGELAAWKISARLALHLVPTEAKLAATSQAHDEARHFYVLHDYLAWRSGAADGEAFAPPPSGTLAFLERILHADHAAQLLLGMQLMVEPLALTLFRLVQDADVDPVLGHLLPLFDRDEARHVALGVVYLPDVLARSSTRDKLDLAVWQGVEYMGQFTMLREHARDLRALGISPRDVFTLARKKQLTAMQEMAAGLGRNLPVTEMFLRLGDLRAELEHPPEEPAGQTLSSTVTTRLKRGVRAFVAHPHQRLYDARARRRRH